MAAANMANATGTRAIDRPRKTAIRRTKGTLKRGRSGAPRELDHARRKAQRGDRDKEHEAGIDPVLAPLQHRGALAPQERDVVGDVGYGESEEQRARQRAGDPER